MLAPAANLLYVFKVYGIALYNMAPTGHVPFLTIEDEDFQLQDTTHNAALALTFNFNAGQSRAVDNFMSEIADCDYWGDWSESDPPINNNGGRGLLGGEDTN